MPAAPSRTIRAPMTTILVVDDEPKITRLVRDYLEAAGSRSRRPSTGEEAAHARADRAAGPRDPGPRACPVSTGST